MSESVIIERREDMSPLGRLALFLQPDGDVIVTICPDPEAAWQNSVEFCQPFSGGGRSPKTLKALRALADAMAKDNEARPIAEEQRELTPFDFARFRTVAELREELDRLRALNAKLVAACEALDKAQRYFEEHAHSPGMMPGNEFYSDMFMEVVNQARAVLAEAREPQQPPHGLASDTA